MKHLRAQNSPRFKKLRLFGHIFCPRLIAELKQRRIPETLAAKYLQQIYVQDMQQPGLKLNGFAFANDLGGYEISVSGPEQSQTTSLHPQAPTTFKAKSSRKVFVFGDMWSFLSWLEMQDTPEPKHHIIVLNALSFYREITGQLIAAREQIDTVVLFLSNDEAGTRATHDMMERLADADFYVHSVNQLYKGYKSFGHYWAKDPGARKITEQKEARVKYYTGDSAWSIVVSKRDTKS